MPHGKSPRTFASLRPDSASFAESEILPSDGNLNRGSPFDKSKTGTLGGRAGLDATSSSYVAFSRHHSFPALLNVPATESIRVILS